MHSRLLVSRIHKPEAHVIHVVHYRQNVVARNAKDILDALKLQGLANQLASADFSDTRHI
jgi:hypothetical protein